jgi:hypothetical protein
VRAGSALRKKNKLTPQSTAVPMPEARGFVDAPKGINESVSHAEGLQYVERHVISDASGSCRADCVNGQAARTTDASQHERRRRNESTASEHGFGRPRKARLGTARRRLDTTQTPCPTNQTQL